MSNKNINQLSVFTDISTGDYIPLWDTSAGVTYKVFVNDIQNVTGSQENWFTDIYVTRNAYLSGIRGGSTGDNLLSGKYPGILAGQTNRAVGNNAAVIAGASNLASGIDSAACGNGCQVLSTRSVAFGGTNNTIAGPGDSAVLGGDTNQMLYGDGNIILGGITNVITGITSYSIICAGQSNRLMALRSATIAGQSNQVSGNDSVNLGGSSNITSGLRSSTIVGSTNQTLGTNSIVLGGNNNKTLGSDSIVLGGTLSIASGASSVVAGNTNQTLGINSFIAGGKSGSAIGTDSFIGGGSTQKAIGNQSVTLGGSNCVASGEMSAVLGNFSEAFPNGAHMFADSTASVKRAYGPDSLTLNYSGACWITGGGFNVRKGFNLYPTGVTPTASIGGRSGDFVYKDDFLYVFTGDNADLSNKNWGRVQLSTLNNTPPSIVSNDSSIVHGGGNAYVTTTAFANVTFGSNSPIISIPAGNNTYIIECVFGAFKGSQSTVIDYFLKNTTDGIMIPNTSGTRSLVAVFNTPTTQYSIKTITGTNYASAKNIQLNVKINTTDDAGGEAQVMSTGTWISYTKLA